MLGKHYSRRHFVIFVFLFQKTGFGIFFKLYPWTRDNLHGMLMLILRKKKKKKKNIIDLSFDKLAQRVVKFSTDAGLRT